MKKNKDRKPTTKRERAKPEVENKIFNRRERRQYILYVQI